MQAGQCSHEALVNSFANCNQAKLAHSLTSQLVAAQVEACESSQLAQLGWNAT